MRFAVILYIFLAFSSAGFADFCCPSGKEDLLRDLITVEEINRRLNDRYPVFYNHLLQGGYISMPSCRMGQSGEIGFGYASVPPYRLWNLRCQLLDRLELSGNYRIFNGVDDPVLTVHGFGDFADKGANLKLALIHPEESDYKLPGFAIGLEDFMGTRAFKAGYIVLTKVFIDQRLEISLGYGRKRINGWFGGLHWMPFRESKNYYLRNLAFTAEYDATPYRNCDIEPHPKGRTKRSPINAGLKYRLWDSIDCSLSYIRGEKWAFTLSGYYNFGSSEGLLPKLDDPFPYRAPVNIEPLGPLRPEVVLVQDLVYAFREQGFEILESWLSFNKHGEKVLRLRVSNDIYRYECNVRERLNHLVAFLMPSNLAEIIIAIDCEGMLIQEYHYSLPYVRAYANKEIGDYELKVLSPLTEATFPDEVTDWRLFKRNSQLFCPDLLPKTYGYFGSSTGKFKYAAGAQVLATGHLSESLYYSAILGYLP
ncbi:MAG: YjbH domain-containing protein, partial [Parachlamydiaceae bacterium]|nr:YjbH domain-containing protein [Parachlamydiaceae bacterium]